MPALPHGDLQTSHFPLSKVVKSPGGDSTGTLEGAEAAWGLETPSGGPGSRLAPFALTVSALPPLPRL